MDPNETLRLILASKTAAEATEHCENLRDWLRNGGFAPEAPRAWWPGTGTQYAIFDPHYDTSRKWVFVHFSPAGERLASWALPESV